MKRNLLLSILLCLSSLSSLAQKELYVQESSEDYSEVQKIMKPLNLSIAIEQGMRKNFGENIRHKSIEILNNNLEDTKESFYLPQVNLVLESSNHRLGTIKNGSRNTGRAGTSPSGSVGVELGDYTIFNWGKDYLQYKSNEASIRRGIEIEKETSREFKQNIINDYIRIIYYKDLVAIKKEQLRNASFIYRMNREKLTLKKISKHDYYQARADYLRSQQEYFEKKLLLQNVYEQMAAKIDDPPGTQYIIEEDYKYTRVKLSKKTAIELAYKNSPYIKTAKVNLNNSKRAHQIAKKDNLPLPKVSLNLGTYKHVFESNSSKTLYETDTGTNNIEVVASISAKWNIFGDGGLLNKRKLANSRLEKENSHWSYKSARRQVENSIVLIFQNIANIEDKMKILEARVPSLKKRLDIALDRYLDRKSRYNDFHLALVELFDAEVTQSSLKYEYFQQKVLLTQIIGIEELPGERFDTIVSKIVN